MERDKIKFRNITEKDLDFLSELYASTRREEMAVSGWSRREIEDFLQMQFTAQHRYYMETFTHCNFWIILLEGRRAGRLYLDRRQKEIRIVDIALLPQYRNKKIGSTLLGEILREGGEKKLPVRIHVESNNPAMSLYRRLGFEKIAQEGVYYLMQWSPGQERSNA